ncbi:hypothetical protein [Nitrosospira lacus]|uniref:hypothetical protein n=1 Tax=Nitrosospira lacus TaxID=1288494 RepID=UPI0013747CD9|nr:hypothetical protein [Nitrosospira lacus]
MWFNTLMGALTALEANVALVQPLVPGNVYSYFVLVLVIGNSVLRIVTTQALTK